MTHDIDAVTARLISRKGWDVPPETYYWANVRLRVALRRVQRPFVRSLVRFLVRIVGEEAAS